MNLINVPTPKLNYLFLFPSHEEGIYNIIINKNDFLLECYQYMLVSPIKNSGKYKKFHHIANIHDININKKKKFFIFKIEQIEIMNYKDDEKISLIESLNISSDEGEKEEERSKKKKSRAKRKK